MTQPQVMSASTGSGNGSFTLPRPAGLADRDLLVCVLTWTYNGVKPSLPAGFTPEGDDTSQGSDTTSPNVLVGFREVTAAESEPGTYAVSGDNNTNHAGVLARVQDVDFDDPLALPFLFTPTPNSTSQTVPGRNLGEDDVLWFGVWALQNYVVTEDNTWSAPAGTTPVGQDSASFNFALVAVEGRDAGAIPDRTAVASGSQSAGKVASFALRGATVTTPPAGEATVREVVSGSGYTSGAGNSIRTLTTGQGTKAGDLLVAFVGADYVAKDAAVPTPTGTAGTWTPRTAVTNDSGASSPTQRPTLGIFTRPVTVDGEQTVTADVATAAGDTAVHLAVWVIKDADLNAPVLGAISVYAGSDTGGAVAPSVPGAKGALLLCGWQSSYTTNSIATTGYTPPASMGNALTTPVADSSVLDAASQPITTSDPTGTRTAARRGTATRAYRAASITIAAAPSGPPTVPASSTLRGGGSLTVSARQAHRVTAALAAAGSVPVAARQTQQAGAALAGAGSLTAGATPGRPVAAALRGAGSVLAAAVQNHRPAAALRGAGSLIAQAGQQGAAELRGAGTLTTSTRQTHAGTAALAGAGSLMAGAQQEHQIRAELAGAGALIAGAARVQPITADLRGAGTLTVTGTRVKVTGADLRGAGRLAAGDVLRTAVSATVLRGAAQLIARATASAGGALNPSLWALDRVTGRLVPLPHHVKLEVHDVENDAGAITVEYPVFGRGFELLRDNVTKSRDLEVEVWLEGRRPTRMVGWLKQRQGDDVTEGAVWSFSGVLVTNRLDEDYVAPQPADEKREFRVAAATPGAIMRALVQQSQTAGVLTDLTMDFSATHDSAGAAWPEVLTAKWSPGVSLLTVAQRLVELGLAEFTVTPDRVFRMWRFGGRGTNRTAGARPTTLRRGQNLLQAGRRQGVDGSGTDFLVAGSEGVYATASDLNARARRGRVIRRYSSVGNLTDQSAVTAAAQRTRDAGTTGNDERTFALALGVGMPRPGTNLAVGDTVRADTDGTIGTERVAQWTVTADVGGAAAQVTAGDLIRSRAAALAKRLADQAGGETVIGTSEPSVDTGIPLAPTGLVVGSAAFTEDTGVVYASVTAGWAAVQSNVDGTAATDIDGYRVEWSLESAPDVWNQGADVVGTTGSFTVAPATPIRVRVQARDRSGNRSAWSPHVLHLTEDDVTPPPVSSAPVCSNYLGTLKITWDGLSEDGVVMSAAAPDFSYVEVHLSAASGFTPDDSTLVGRLYGRGDWVVTDLPYEVAQFARLVAVDVRANRADPSGQGSATPAKLVNIDFGPDSVDTAQIRNLAVGRAEIMDLAVNNAKMSDVEMGKVTAGQIKAAMIFTAGGLIGTRAPGSTVQGWEGDSAGIRFYNNANVNTINFSAATGGALVTGEYRTALAGARIVLNPGGSSPAESRWYPASTNMYARIRPSTSVAIGYEGQGGVNLKAYSNRVDNQSGEVNVYPGLASLVWGNEVDNGRITSRIAASDVLAFVGGPRARISANIGQYYGIQLSLADASGAIVGQSSLIINDQGPFGLVRLLSDSPNGNSGIQFNDSQSGFHGISVIDGGGNLVDVHCRSARQTSDRRGKTDIEVDPIDAVAAVRGAHLYRYRHDGSLAVPETEPTLGLMADELPAEIVSGAAGAQSVSIYGATAVLWGAVREVLDRLELLEGSRV